jgi:hypothetical protein
MRIKLLIAGLGLVAGVHSAPAQGTYLNIAMTVSNQVILSWPAAATNFVLQSTTNLAAPAWDAVANAPVVVNGEYQVTNTASDPQRLYRLSTFNIILPGGSTMGKKSLVVR